MSRVGVDIDGVLYPFAEEFNRLTGHDDAPITKWAWYEDFGMSRKRFVDECNWLVLTGDLFYQGDPYPGAVAQMQRLKEAGHTIVLITNRNFTTCDQSATELWLREHAIPYDELHFVKDKTTIQVDYHIDDNVDNYGAMSGAGVHSFLCDRPWNRQARVGVSLKEYVDIILEVEGTMNSEVRITSPTGGAKGTKLARFDLIPPSIWKVAELYGAGATKYAPWNWRQGYDWSLSYAALQRHANQFWAGEDFDPETGCAHMASVAFHALALLTFMEEQKSYDDRFDPSRMT